MSSVPSTPTPSAPPICSAVSSVAEPTPASAAGSEPMTDSVDGPGEADADTDEEEGGQQVGVGAVHAGARQEAEADGR